MPVSPCVYLNHAGTSWPKPAVVRDAVREAWEVDPQEWGNRFETAHRKIADYFCIPDLSQLLFTPACTTALSIAVGDHFWKAGDRVLTSGFEHHALHRPLVKLVDQGVDLEIIPHLPQEPILLEALEELLRGGNVKLVAISMASNVTGDILPFEEVIRLSHRYGAKVLLDAAQVVGWWELDLPRLGADLLAFAGHKGPQAPWGIGGLYLAPDLAMNSPAAICEINYDKHSGRPQPSETGPGWCDGGSVDRLALAGLAAGVRWLSEPAQAERLEKARALTQQIEDWIRSLPNTIVYGTNDPNGRMPTVAFNVINQPARRVAQALLDRGIYVAGGIQCAPLTHKSLDTAPEGVVRISFGPASTCDHMTAAAEEIALLAKSWQ